jgi:hypothetical protein
VGNGAAPDPDDRGVDEIPEHGAMRVFLPSAPHRNRTDDARPFVGQQEPSGEDAIRQV